MPKTEVQRPAAPRKPAATREQKRAATRKRRAVKSKPPTSALERSTELSEQVFDSLESAQRSAIEAVRKFVDTVDRTLPPQAANPSRRQEVIDSALEMADRLVHVQYDFLRRVVDDAGRALARSDEQSVAGR